MKMEIKKSIISLMGFLILLKGVLFSQEYYPLQIGNKWNYIDTSWEWNQHYITDTTWEWIPVNGSIDTTSIKVISYSKMPNGLYYYVLDNPDLLGGRYVRVDSNWIHYYRENDSADVSFLKLNASPNDQWEANFGWFDLITLDRVDTIDVFNITTRILNYRLDGLVLSYISISDQFGPPF